ncbi:SAM-dependent methyltransferase [Nitrospira defluvii]|uniref:SAM-dependent methyltransferase n=1 Tax=Nitrospira defluvii TaxID=330214 RepID=A0ABM8RKS3_9BACT|nr:class I SAM-dependent methyltransferase [Nitrospira defluvii]CAE6758462.1 SAM-dependent methyltransferase [Nitrospira defluvii]
MKVQTRTWPLPAQDDWSTPFAELLLEQLDLRTGLRILDIASGHGIPAFYLAERVGPTGSVIGIDASRSQVASARAIQRAELPWLRFDCVDMRALPASLPTFQRITGNLSVMFLRPNRFEAMKGLIEHLEPGGQLVLTFPSLGTFDSIWKRIDQEMSRHGLTIERERLAAHVAERPSAAEARGWLEQLAMERIDVIERPLEVASGSGQRFLQHPLLRGGFLDDAYECFEDAGLADTVMSSVAADLESMIPLTARRCALSGWKPHA